MGYPIRSHIEVAYLSEIPKDQLFPCEIDRCMEMAEYEFKWEFDGIVESGIHYQCSRHTSEELENNGIYPHI